MIDDSYVFVFVKYLFSFISISFLTRFQFTDTALFLGCVSITVVQTGSTAEDTGPTRIFFKGEKKSTRFTEKLLEKHGLAPGSTIVITPNAYMTDETWVLL